MGTLTRYYSGQWETIVARSMREQGIPVQTIRPEGAGNAGQEVEQIAGEVDAWRASLSKALADRLPAALAWPEGMAAPDFTDRPDWDGLGGVILRAAYLEQPKRQRPIDPDGAFEAQAQFGFAILHGLTVTAVEHGLPVKLDF